MIIRYMSILGESESFGNRVKEALENCTWILNKIPPKVPYIELEIKVVDKENLFLFERISKKRIKKQKGVVK